MFFELYSSLNIQHITIATKINKYSLFHLSVSESWWVAIVVCNIQWIRVNLVQCYKYNKCYKVNSKNLDLIQLINIFFFYLHKKQFMDEMEYEKKHTQNITYTYIHTYEIKIHYIAMELHFTSIFCKMKMNLLLSWIVFSI